MSMDGFGLSKGSEIRDDSILFSLYMDYRLITIMEGYNAYVIH